MDMSCLRSSAQRNMKPPRMYLHCTLVHAQKVNTQTTINGMFPHLMNVLHRPQSHRAK